jgi:hypothetical protein
VIADGRGVVDQDVEFAVRARDAFEEIADLVVVGVVDENRDPGAAEGGYLCGGVVDGVRRC